MKKNVQEPEAKLLLSCGGKDCCTDVRVYADRVELIGKGKTRGKIVMPRNEFESLKQAVKAGKI